MRFSTERDYNYHQRETVAECEHAACAHFHMHIYRLWPTFSRIRLLQSFYELFCLLFLRNLCTFMLLMWRCVCGACPCAYACVWSLNLLHLCLVECIYMKRRLTFLFRLKPRRPDILLTVAGDILPLLPQEDYITPLLSPLISLSTLLFIPPLLCPIPLLLFNISPLFPTVVITLKRQRGTKTLRWEQKHIRITCVRHFLEKDRIREEMSRAKQGLRETTFQSWCLSICHQKRKEKRLKTKR